jgi:iron complex outermembrane receptor protein
MSIVPDKVFTRVSGGFNKIDGYVDTIDFTCANPTLAGSIPRQVPQNSAGSCKTGTTGGDQAAVLRGNLRILPSDSVEININGDLLDNQGQAGAEKLIAVNTEGSAPLCIRRAAPSVPTPPAMVTGSISTIAS